MEERDHLPWNKGINYDLEILYNLTEEQALGEHKKWKTAQQNKTAKKRKDKVSKYDHYKNPDFGPLGAWYHAQHLRVLGEIFENSGEKNTILEALYICALEGFPLPKWLEISFVEAYGDIVYKAHTSWDDVFGKPHPKGTRANDEREKILNAFLVWKRVQERKEEGYPIDESLFLKVGLELGIGGKTKVSELYYFFKDFDKNTFFHMIDPQKLLVCKK